MKNKSLIFGIVFQLTQLLALLIWGLTYSAQYVKDLLPEMGGFDISLTPMEYNLIFGGILLLGMNILSIFLIINGLNAKDNE